jgi:transcription elongation factor GreA
MGRVRAVADPAEMTQHDAEPTDVRAAAPRLLLTAAEHAAHVRELERLRAVRDHDLPAQMREARTFVTADAIEEGTRLLEEQTMLHARIAGLEDLLAGATVLPEGEGGGMVSLGSLVEVRYPRTGRSATYQVTGTGAGAGVASVSARSPVGQALMGAQVGDVVSAHLPGGHTEDLEIVAIEPLHEAA